MTGHKAVSLGIAWRVLVYSFNCSINSCEHLRPPSKNREFSDIMLE